MTALTRLLFPVPAIHRSPEMILAWWESRRPIYNLIVGGTGLVTLVSISVIELLPPHPPLHVPWQLIVLYGIAANVCYTFGFAIETLLERLWGNEVPPAGPVLFRQGLAFSVGLTLLPIGMAWIAYLVSIVKLLL